MDWVHLAWRKENLGRKDEFPPEGNEFLFPCLLLCFLFKADSTIYQDTLGKGEFLCWLSSDSISALKPRFCAVLCGAGGNLQQHFSFARQFRGCSLLASTNRELSTETVGGKKGWLLPCSSVLVSITPEQSFILAAAMDSSLWLSQQSRICPHRHRLSSLDIWFPAPGL